jgi:hypothetical protein
MNPEQRLSDALHAVHDSARPSPDLEDRILERVTGTNRGRFAPGPSRRFGRSFDFRLAAPVVAGLVLVAVVSVAIGGGWAGRTGAAASGSQIASASASQSSVAEGTESTPASPQPTSIGFMTPGVASDWKGFSWTQLPNQSPFLTIDDYAGALQLVNWTGGFALRVTMNGGDDSALWTSPDGESWTKVTAMVQPGLVAAGPAGLVVIGDQSSQTVWTSSDGKNWRNAGLPVGVDIIDSLAGTTAGLVATVHSVVGSGKFATGAFSVAFSSDGVNWTTQAIEPGIAWDEAGPAVQSGNGRFFLMGGYTGGTAFGDRPVLASLTQPGGHGSGVLGSTMTGTGGLWWSDDGRTWTSSKFGGYYGTQIQFGRDGMLMSTSDHMVPGTGPHLESSIDGGKTWTSESTFSPLGATPTWNEGEGAGTTGPDGVTGSNGSIFLAVKSNGQAWTSSDGRNWTSIPWTSSLPFSWTTPLWVLPCGVVVGTMYGAAT